MSDVGEAGHVANLVTAAAADALADEARTDAATSEAAGTNDAGTGGVEVPSGATSDLIAAAAADAVAAEASGADTFDRASASEGAEGAAQGASVQSAPPTFRVMDIADVSLDLPSAYPTVTLVENEQPLRSLVFPVGLTEGTALAQALRRMESPRPLTHELFVDVLSRARIDVIALRITGRESGNYLAELDLMAPMGRERVPCRPSDGLILAMRMPVAAPILVDERLLEVPGDVVPQDDY